jgi:hypothetical protein
LSSNSNARLAARTIVRNAHCYDADGRATSPMLGGATTISVADCDRNVVGRSDSYELSSVGPCDGKSASNRSPNLEHAETAL